MNVVAASPSQVLLAAREMHKAFPGTVALDGVSLELRAGEIHALLGGNGSGKSTLTKALAGVQPADRGTLALGGSEYDASTFTPDDAWEAGLRFVHQQPSTFPDLTVAENLAVGAQFECSALGQISWSRQRRAAQAVLDRFEVPVSPRARLSDLSAANRTLVAIARALASQREEGSGVLVLDEPTASLPERDAQHLLASLQRYAAEGRSIVFISHRLPEVLQIADRATVLRDGAVAGTLERAEIEHDRLVALIVGGQLDRRAAGGRPAFAAGMAPAVTVRGLSCGRASGIDLDLRPGEITGLAGLVGSGRSSILAALGGARAAAGDVTVGGRPLTLGSVAAAMAAGVAYLPEHRGDMGFFDHSLTDNLAMVVMPRYRRRLGSIDRAGARRAASDLISGFGVRAASEEALLSTLSGGNQQKVLLARWLQREPRLLLLDEPTHGVDIGARAELHAVVRDAAAGGAAVLVASSDAEELVALCDRCVVLVAGRVSAEVRCADLTADDLNSLTYSEAR